MNAAQTKTVLIADDEPHVARVVQLSLERVGCRVALAASGAAALSKAADRIIHLMIVDIAMPGMDGFETVRQMKLKPGYESLPVIMLTGSGDTSLREAAESLGVSAFLTKPFSPAELQRRVKTLLDL